jgi:hypothetical protein
VTDPALIEQTGEDALDPQFFPQSPTATAVGLQKRAFEVSGAWPIEHLDEQKE